MTEASLATPATAPTPAQKVTLDWSWQNILVLGGASGLAHLGIQLGTELYKLFTAPMPPSPTALPQQPNPLSWLPPGLLSAASPRVAVELPQQAGNLVFVELHYLGHVLYYQPCHRWLIWRVATGTLLAVLSATHLDAIAEHLPYQSPEPMRWLDSPPPALAPRQPKFLG